MPWICKQSIRMTLEGGKRALGHLKTKFELSRESDHAAEKHTSICFQTLAVGLFSLFLTASSRARRCARRVPLKSGLALKGGFRTRNGTTDRIPKLFRKVYSRWREKSGEGGFKGGVADKSFPFDWRGAADETVLRVITRFRSRLSYTDIRWPV